MSNVINLKSSQVNDEAIEWVVKIDRELSSEEQAEFITWLSQSPEHQAVFTQHAKLWDKMDAVSALAEIFPEHETESVSKGWGINVKAMAACVAAVGVLVAGVTMNTLNTSAPTQTIIAQNNFETTLGEQSTFYMQDNTKLVLNTNSKVRVTYTDKQRLFELERGELHVTVAHNDELPLSVHANGQVIQAVGTAFNVEIQHDEVELIVTEGKVLVAEDDPALDPMQLTDVYLPTTSLPVSEGQMVQLGSLNTDVTTLEMGDVKANLSWKQGNLIFRGETLEEALQEVSRYTRYDFEFSDDDIKTLRIAGLFKTEEVDTLLAAIAQNLDVQHLKVENAEIIRLYR